MPIPSPAEKPVESISLPPPFTAHEWYAISMCIGRAIVTWSDEVESERRLFDLAESAAEAPERVLGEQPYHRTIQRVIHAKN